MIRKLIFFFPLQLFLVNLKRNHLLLFFWIILFGITGEYFVNKYGIPYLFLAPEYLGTISFWSYFIMGISIGGFVMSFNISSYILNSLRFPFIAALRRPFLRYCINNSLLPLIFILFYTLKVIFYHLENENSSGLEIFIYVLGIISGYIFNIIISLTYFLTTNKNIFEKLGITPHRNDSTPVQSLLLKDENLYKSIKKRGQWRVESYLYNPFKIKPARDISHYDKKMLEAVFSQNHLNASIFELVIFISFLALDFFSENPIFIIPAGASVVLFFTMVLILLSAFHTWLKGWTTIVFVGLFILINFLSKHQIFTYTNMAYGLNYQTEKATYTIDQLNDLSTDTINFNEDKKNSLAILSHWKSNNQELDKPKIIFINTSGGGLRSTLWTYHTLHYVDSVLNGALFKQTHLITGSSGGMIGAAYYREVYLQKMIDKSTEHYLDNFTNISKDLLNPVALSMVTNDIFIRVKKYNDGKYTYTKDRGYAFEKQLIINTKGLLDKRLLEYAEPERNSLIPQMIFSPTIINDGRRLLIAAQPISFLSQYSNTDGINHQPIVENVEFMRLFQNQDAVNLRFTSAIRMSATFPYIMPNVSLPSRPQINVMDAGMRDNCGTLTTLKYISTFKKWINQNTSGVIIVQLRDKGKEKRINKNSLLSIAESFSSPIESLYGNLFAVQDYHVDNLSQYLKNEIDQPIDIINFEMENEENNVSLSWHLTTKEKEAILSAIHSASNQNALHRLKENLN